MRTARHIHWREGKLVTTISNIRQTQSDLLCGYAGFNGAAIQFDGFQLL
jgi:hypothetical protein